MHADVVVVFLALLRQIGVDLLLGDLENFLRFLDVELEVVLFGEVGELLSWSEWGESTFS